MMNFRSAVTGLGVLAAATLGAGAAMAAPAYVTTSLNLRAGPGMNYPVVATMGAGSSVFVYGCLSAWSWCDIGWNGYRGWAMGTYLQVVYQQRRYPIVSYGYRVRVPFITFSIGTYWDRHYHHRRFYRDMNRYQTMYHGSATINGNTTTTIRHHNKPSVTIQQNNTQNYTTSPNKHMHMNGQYNMQTNHQYHMDGQLNGNLNQQGSPNLNRHYNKGQGKIFKCKPGQQMVNGTCQ